MSVESDTMHYYAQVDADDAFDERVERLIESDDDFAESFATNHATRLLTLANAGLYMSAVDLRTELVALQSLVYADARIYQESKDREVDDV